MKQRFLVLLLAIGLLVVLVVLNALTYVQKQTEADSEFNPNRSTFNPAATGDPIYFSDPQTQKYVRLDAALYRRIESGDIRL